MPIRINDASVIESFDDMIPRAASLGETYLRAVARGVQEYEPPVTMELDFITTGGFRAENIQALVVAPTKNRLRHYKTAHFAIPTGGALRVGWYLVGGEKAGGYGSWGIGAVTDMEADEVLSIREMVHTYAVLPAIQEIVNTVQFGSSQAGGFFGV